MVVMITFNPLYTASRGDSSKRSSRNSFPNSYSSPELLNDSEEYGEPSGLQVQLDPEEKTFLPMFSTQESGSIAMKGEYLSREAIPEWGLRGKHYLNSHDRKQYELTFKDNVYRDSLGNLLHGEYLFIMLPNNRLYGCKPGTQRFHSYLSSGLNVKAAGILFCYYGVIVTVSNESGHYKPTTEEMRPALARLAKNAVCPLIFEDHSAVSPDFPFKGIKHFQVNLEDQNLELALLDSTSLKQNIDLSIDYAQKSFKTTAFSTLTKSEPTLTSSLSDYDFGAYYDDGGGDEQIIKSASTEPLPEELYLRFTCLCRINQQNARSRFLGMPTLK